ncbi:hypothetical protein BDZ97DRAFT_1912033 [Flammula alnicola]|nr:hypothetical protein BDZ97DRAFT_1912033 [Flammula alnicola]
MDPAYQNKKIVDLTDEELRTLKFLGQNVAPGVRAMVEKVRADPVNLGTVTCFMVDCLNRRYSAQAPPQDAVGSPTSPTFPTSPTISEADTLYSQLSNDSDALTVIPPALISKFEMKYWYHGISGNPPELMWRSDLEANPFPIPALGARFFKIPKKTAHGVFNTPLNAVWGTVAPQILASMKAHGLKYSALKTVRFSTVEDGKEETFGQSWCGSLFVPTPPTPRLFAMPRPTSFKSSLTSRSPMSSSSGQHQSQVRPQSPFNTGLGIPIARESDDAQGTLTFLFREDPRPHNKHVASVDTTTHYEFDGANPQHILVCGERRLARAVVEIEDAVNTGFRDAVRLAGELADLGLKLGGKNSTALGRKQIALDAKNEDNATLQTLFAEVQGQWQDTNGRRFGDVDWAPEISVRVDDRHDTRDIATFTVDGAKLAFAKFDSIQAMKLLSNVEDLRPESL